MYTLMVILCFGVSLGVRASHFEYFDTIIDIGRCVLRLNDFSSSVPQLYTKPSAKRCASKLHTKTFHAAWLTHLCLSVCL
jgi:hypothetical protein